MSLRLFGASKKVCKDSPASVTRYLGRLSGPVADRIDLHYWVKADEPNEDMTMVEERIQKVWSIQKERGSQKVSFMLVTLRVNEWMNLLK